MNKISTKEKIKKFISKKYKRCHYWFTEKKHPRSRLNRNVFFYDVLKLIGLILILLIINSNLEKLNNVVLIFIKLGSTLQLVLAFFIIKKIINLIKNLRYAYRGSNKGTKAILAIVLVLILFIAFLNQSKIINNFEERYNKIDLAKLSPVTLENLNLSIGENKPDLNKKIVLKCETDFKEDIKKAEMKDPNVQYVILDTFSTWDKNEALNYIGGWNLNDESKIKNYLENNFKQNPTGLRYADQEEIEIIIYRYDGRFCMDSCEPYSEARASICDGENAKYFQSSVPFGLF